MMIPYPYDIISAKAVDEPIFDRNYVRACFIFSLIDKALDKFSPEREKAVLEATKKILEVYEEDAKKEQQQDVCNSNTANGAGAGRNLKDGDNNIFLGADAGENLERGNNNIVIGNSVELPKKMDDTIVIGSLVLTKENVATMRHIAASLLTFGFAALATFAFFQNNHYLALMFLFFSIEALGVMTLMELLTKENVAKLMDLLNKK